MTTWDRRIDMARSATAVGRTKVKHFESILLSTLDEKLFFGNLARAFKESFPCDRAIIFKGMDDGTPVFVSDSECPGAAPYILDKERGGIAGHVIRSSRPYYSNNTQRDPLFHGAQESQGFRAELCVPIIIAGQTLATIHLQNRTSANFGQRYISRVQEFINRLERPLNNMKMYLTAKHLNEALKEEIEQRARRMRQQGDEDGRMASQHLIKDLQIIGQSARINEIRNLIGKLSKVRGPILLQGDSGVGKEAIARKIHVQRFGEQRPFVVASSSALTEETFDREMFGHVKGAFFGTDIKKVGLCEMAHGGTLFIDNIAQLSSSMQIKILRFLETKKVYKIGSQRELLVDVQIIVSSNGNLQKVVEAGRFREDLYFMLKGFAISVPRLNERQEDIGPLANFFLNQNRSAMDRKNIEADALAALQDYRWPGNVRELKSVMERAYLMSEGKTIRTDHLPADVLNGEGGDLLEDREVGHMEMTLGELEERHILRTLDFAKGNKTKTAKILGITVKTLYNKLHSYGMVRTKANSAIERAG